MIVFIFTPVCFEIVVLEVVSWQYVQFWLTNDYLIGSVHELHPTQ